jgi:hypothetical protein
MARSTFPRVPAPHRKPRPQFLEGSGLGLPPDLLARETGRATGMASCNLIVMQICSNLWPESP